MLDRYIKLTNIQCDFLFIFMTSHATKNNIFRSVCDVVQNKQTTCHNGNERCIWSICNECFDKICIVLVVLAFCNDLFCFFYLPYLFSIHKKAHCIAIFGRDESTSLYRRSAGKLGAAPSLICPSGCAIALLFHPVLIST